MPVVSVVSELNRLLYLAWSIRLSKPVLSIVTGEGAQMCIEFIGMLANVNTDPSVRDNSTHIHTVHMLLIYSL